MTLTLTAWQIITLVITLFGGLVGGAKLLFSLVEKSLKQSDKQLSDALGKVAEKLEKESADIRRIDRDVLELKAVLPKEYVSKNDFVRSFTVVEHKLDALGTKLELANIKAAVNAYNPHDKDAP